MHDFPILFNVTIALVVALVGGLLARRVQLPPLVGYLIAGMIIGPFTPGFVGDSSTITQLADLGVIFLLFGVGLHFSLRDLWRVRAIAIPGAVMRMALTTIVTLGLTRLWGWSLSAGIVVGLAVSIASTVVLLRNLVDRDLLRTPAGQVAVGWLVIEDLATVLILVLLPVLSPTANGIDWWAMGSALLKAGAFAVLMLVVGARVLPWVLERMATLHSRELFIVAIMAMTLGTAVAAATLFGVSLALGAFLAGAVLSESTVSHQISVEVLPFRETFAVLFFVSVGMLVNPLTLVAHAWEVLALVAVIIVGKALLTFGLGFILRWPAQVVLVVALGLSQIGEFSFILGQTGVEQGILSADHYSLVLAGAVISITLNPLLFRTLPWLTQRMSGWATSPPNDEALALAIVESQRILEEDDKHPLSSAAHER